ncbi:hypothetical protein KCU77_g19407, partial [Aureobasidium melanogenum]
MRTSSAVWAAALAVMSVQGPILITAEAAPAPQQGAGPGQQMRYYFPRPLKRQNALQNTTSSSTSSTSPASETQTSTPNSWFQAISSLLSESQDPSSTSSFDFQDLFSTASPSTALDAAAAATSDSTTNSD